MRIRNLQYGESGTTELKDILKNRMTGIIVKTRGRVTFEIVNDGAPHDYTNDGTYPTSPEGLYWTDNNGDGLWHQAPNSLHGKQIRGTCQFSAHGISRSGLRKKIRREIIEY